MKEFIKDFAPYVVICISFYLFLVWIAVMQTPARNPGAYPQVPLTSNAYNY